MTGSGLGPREYAVEPEHVPFVHRRNVKIVASVALVLAVGGGAFGVAQAFSGSTPKAVPPAAGSNGVSPGVGGFGGARPNRSGALRGMVTAIGATSFTITTRTGSQVIDVDAKTTYRSADGSSGSFSALKVNEFVSVTVEPNATPPVAVGVTVSTAGSFGGGGVGRFGANLTVGSVTSVGTHSFVIASRSFGGGGAGSTSSVTIDVTPSTTFQSGSPTSGLSSGSFSDVKKGVNVFVTGTKSGSTVDAKTVTIIPAGEFGGRGGGRFGGGFAGGSGGSASGGTGT